MTYLLRVCILSICIFALAGCTETTPTLPANEPIELRLATIPHLNQLAQDLAQAFSQTYPYVVFKLSVRPARNAIDSVANQEVDIALVAEPLDASRENLESIQIGRRAVVLAVHPSNPSETLTWDQVRDIFSGRVWDWTTIDSQWPSQEILVVSQHEGAVSRVAFEEQVMQDISVTPRAVVATGDEVAGQLIAEEPAAIGYLLAGVADDNVKALNIEGVMPSSSTVTSGAWPIARPIILVTHIDANVYVLDFLDFSQGQVSQRLIGQQYGQAR